MFRNTRRVFVVLAILVVGGGIWFTLNPLFPSEETGKLHVSASRDLTIEAGQATVAIQLEARVNENAMRTSGGPPGPPALTARIIPTETGSVEGVRLTLSPGDAISPVSAVRETAPGHLTWSMPCLDTKAACRQIVVLVVEAPQSAAERKLRLFVEGDLRYPAFTPTPGWSAFDLDLRSVGAREGMGPNPVADASGTVALSMSKPVVAVPVHVGYGATTPAADPGPPPAALRLTLETVRMTETAPTGFDAPEPVRATVLAADGTVVARLGVRPGDAPTLAVPLGPCASGCASDYRIVFEWMDRRPDADYRLTWRAELVGLPADDRAAVAVAMRAGDPEVAEQAGTTLAPLPGGGPLRAPRLRVEIGGLPLADVSSSPVHVQMLVTATVDPASEIGANVVSITTGAIEGGNLGVPFDVEAGGTGAIVVDFEDGCHVSRCDRWVLDTAIPNQVAASPSEQLEVTWQLEVRAWRLVPDPAPITLSVDVQ